MRCNNELLEILFYVFKKKTINFVHRLYLFEGIDRRKNPLFFWEVPGLFYASNPYFREM